MSQRVTCGALSWASVLVRRCRIWISDWQTMSANILHLVWSGGHIAVNWNVIGGKSHLFYEYLFRDGLTAKVHCHPVSYALQFSVYHAFWTQLSHYRTSKQNLERLAFLRVNCVCRGCTVRGDRWEFLQPKFSYMAFEPWSVYICERLRVSSYSDPYYSAVEIQVLNPLCLCSHVTDELIDC